MPRRRKHSRKPKVDDLENEVSDNSPVHEEHQSDDGENSTFLEAELSLDIKDYDSEAAKSPSELSPPPPPLVAPTALPPQRTGRRGRPPGSKNKNNISLSRDGSYPSRSLRNLTPASRDRDGSNELNDDSVPSSSFPSRRGGRRGGRWATRGGRKAGTTHSTSLVDASGNPLVIENDEIVFPTNPKGETKINADGELLGGRQFRVRTFTVMGRGSRQYMLSTEPARCMGFRDSYLLFQKHKKLHKVIVSDDEKYDLIERDLIPHSYKGRAIGIVTAKSVFREFGAKIIVGGRRIIDDYDEDEAKALGHREGEIADPTDRLPQAGAPYNKNQYVAWHGASAVYHQYTNNPPARSENSNHGMGFGSGLGLNSLGSLSLNHGNKESYVKRKKLVITDESWMYEHASAAREFNHEIYERRKRAFSTLGSTPEESVAKAETAGLLVCSTSSTPGGIYEPHTGLFFYPQSTQPKRARYRELCGKLDDKELNKLGVVTKEETLPSVKQEEEEEEEEDGVIRFGRGKRDFGMNGKVSNSNNVNSSADKTGSDGSTSVGNVFVAHPEIVIDTQIGLHHPLVPLTGLADVPSFVFESVGPEIKKAILEQQRIERMVMI